VVNENNGTNITLDGLSTVVTSNLLGQNSIVYSIDTVLLPADLNSSFAPSSGVPSNASSINSVAPSSFLLQPSISPLPTMAPFPTTNLTLGQYLDIISGYSSFSSALFIANLFNQTLQTTMQTTLFAPDNAAFSTLNATLASHLLENPGFQIHLQNLLLYHEVNGTRVSNLTGGMVLNMMNGEDIVVHMSTLSSSGEVTYSLGNDNNQIFAAVSNKPAVALANGIFYGITGGLLLPSFAFHNLTAKIASLGDVNVLSNFISQSGLAEFLASGEYTVLAPLDSAWNTVNPSLIAELSDPSNIVKLQQVILYHVIPRVTDFAQIVSGSYTTCQGSDVVVTVGPDGTVAFGNNSLVVSPNCLAENGIIHEISQVLIPQFTPDWPTSTPLSSGPTVSPAPSPPPTLSVRPSGAPTASPAPTITPMPTTPPQMYKSLLPTVTRSPTLTQPSQAPFVRSNLPNLGDYILSQENYMALTTALKACNLFNLTTDAMQPMTLFGPSNNAFSAVDQSVVEKLLRVPGFILQAQNLMLYHFIEGEIPLDKMVNGKTFRMLNQEDIVVSIQNNKTIALGNDKQVFTTIAHPDIWASNGNFDGLNSGLLLPSFMFTDLVQKIENTSDLSTLASLIKTAGLHEALTADALTMLAPTNAAFKKLSKDYLSYITNPSNVNELRNVLLYHVLPLALPTSQISSTWYATVEGSDVLASKSGDKITLNNATITQANLLAVNGIIQLIDTVLLPSSTQSPSAAPTSITMPFSSSSSSSTPTRTPAARSGAARENSMDMCLSWLLTTASALVFGATGLCASRL